MRADHLSAYMSLGELLNRLNRTREALDVFESARAIEPNSADLSYNVRANCVCVTHISYYCAHRVKCSSLSMHLVEFE